MKYFQVSVQKEPTEYGFMPFMQLYLLDGNEEKRPVVLIAPGGGYTTLSIRSDADKVAMQYNAAGFHAAVLHYSVKPHCFPQPQQDMLLAIRMLRENAEEWKIREDAVAVCGFSAGGHLCASVSTLWQRMREDGTLDCKAKDAMAQNAAARNDAENAEEEAAEKQIKPDNRYRPDAAVLCYAILTTRLGHCKDFLADHTGCDLEKLNLAACDMQVSALTPPTFMYGTIEDKLTNVENILYYSEQLSKCGVPFESHIFPKGGHGASWCDDTIWAKPARGRDYNYIRLSVEWMRELFGLL